MSVDADQLQLRTQFERMARDIGILNGALTSLNEHAQELGQAMERMNVRLLALKKDAKLPGNPVSPKKLATDDKKIA